jgi:MFS family permease
MLAVGLGAMFGALTLAMRQGLRGLGNIVAYSAMGLGGSLILFGASRWYWVSLAAMALAGFAMMMQFASTNTLIQAMVPDQLRGRVMSLYSMMFLGMSPFGSLVAGTLADHIGAQITVALGGLASLAGGVVFARKWPSMRAPAREMVALQGMSQPQPPPEVNSPQG